MNWLFASVLLGMLLLGTGALGGPTGGKQCQSNCCQGPKDFPRPSCYEKK